MRNKLIIATFVGCLIASFAFLAYTEQNNEKIERQNLWFLYFVDLKASTLDFSVENHTANTHFHWEILADKTKIQEGDFVVNKNETTTINVSPLFDSKDKKITIRVTAQDNSVKEIYKTF